MDIKALLRLSLAIKLLSTILTTPPVQCQTRTLPKRKQNTPSLPPDPKYRQELYEQDSHRLNTIYPRQLWLLAGVLDGPHDPDRQRAVYREGLTGGLPHAAVAVPGRPAEYKNLANLVHFLNCTQCVWQSLCHPLLPSLQNYLQT